MHVFLNVFRSSSVELKKPCKVSIHRDVLCMSKPNQTLVCKELCVWYTVHVSVQSLTFVWIRFHTVAQPKLFAREWSAWTAQTHKGGISAIWFLNILVALVAEPCSIFYNGICFITACQSAVQQDILLEAIRRPGAKGVFCRQHWVALMFLPPFLVWGLVSHNFKMLPVTPRIPWSDAWRRTALFALIAARLSRALAFIHLFLMEQIEHVVLLMPCDAMRVFPFLWHHNFVCMLLPWALGRKLVKKLGH